MLTEEQIKNLKNGDTVIYQGKFIGITDMNEIAICDTQSKPYICFARDRIGLSIPLDKPKYDHTRRFKKGDIVRVVEWNGRGIARVGMEGCVVEDESSSKVELAIDGWTNGVFYPACHIELVTPVEELEPYSINPETPTDIFKNGEWYAHISDADEAELICQCLNEKHRKEQNNG